MVDSVHLINGTAELRYLSVDYTKVPLDKQNFGNYKCNNEQYDFIVKMRKDIKQLKDEIDTTKESIIGTLLTLKTIKRVIENFPDAAPYAKPYMDKKNTAISLPIDDISKILNKYKK